MVTLTTTTTMERDQLPRSIHLAWRPKAAVGSAPHKSAHGDTLCSEREQAAHIGGKPRRRRRRRRRRLPRQLQP